MLFLEDWKNALGAVGGIEASGLFRPSTTATNEASLTNDNLVLGLNEFTPVLSFPNDRPKPVDEIAFTAKVIAVCAGLDIALDRWHPLSRSFAFREKPRAVPAVKSFAFVSGNLVELHLALPSV